MTYKMPNREEVIKVFKYCYINNSRCSTFCPYYSRVACIKDLHKDILKLLEEPPEIVHCKDCKHSEYIAGRGYRCEIWEYSFVLDDGFCYHGERNKIQNG